MRYISIFNLFPHFFTISVGRSSVLHQLAERSSSLFLLVSPGKENKFSNTKSSPSSWPSRTAHGRMVKFTCRICFSSKFLLFRTLWTECRPTRRRPSSSTWPGQPSQADSRRSDNTLVSLPVTGYIIGLVGWSSNSASGYEKATCKYKLRVIVKHDIHPKCAN